MLTLEQVADWIEASVKELTGIVSVGCIDGNKEKYVGVYPLRGGTAQRICIGGKEQTKYQSKRVSVLIHWTKDMRQAEQKANEMYELLYGLTNVQMGDTKVVLIDAGEAPVPVGKDTQGICEFVIQATILHERI